MKMREALDLLGLKPPKAAKGESQREFDEHLSAWKADEIPKARKATMARLHPDNPETGDAEAFRLIPEAVEKVQRLKMRVPKQVADKCVCGCPRYPLDSRFCVVCGKSFHMDEPMTECPVCDAERTLGKAAYCHACGYSYKGTGNAEETPEQELRRKWREKTKRGGGW